MNNASKGTITVFQHTHGKLERERQMMRKACATLTFPMTGMDGCAPSVGLLIYLEMCL